MAASFFTLMSDEILVAEEHPSAMNFLGTILIGIALLAVYGLGLLFLLGVFINIQTTCYVVTNKRVIAKRGWLNTTRAEVRISDIRGIKVNRSFSQRIFGIGDVEIGTAATAGVEIVINGIANPEAFMSRINEQR